jgi:hypothetical protein
MYKKIVTGRSAIAQPRRARRQSVSSKLENLEPRLLLAQDLVSPLALEIGDFDRNGQLGVADIDSLSLQVRTGTIDKTFDVNQDGTVSAGDRQYWVDAVRRTYFGDSTLDGLFDTSDLVAVFQAGRYEDGIPQNASWASGDWDGDGDFGTADLVAAFQGGGFERGFRSVAQPRFDLAPESDAGPTGDQTTDLEVVALVGQADPFAAIELSGTGHVGFADRSGQFRITNVALILGDNELTITAADINGTQSASQMTVYRILVSSESEFAYAPWGAAVNFDALYPEIPRSLTTAFLPTGVTRQQLLDSASTKTAAVEPGPDEPEPDVSLETSEQEPSNTSGQNDTVATAEPIGGLGTGVGETSQALIEGVLTPISTPIVTVEDDGDINKATPTSPHLAAGTAVIATARIGDGPFGSAAGGTGDFDFYAVRALAKDQKLTIDINTPETSSLDSFILVWNAAGQVVDVNDEGGTPRDSFLQFIAPADGDYFVSVAGWGSFGPIDPFDSSSGFGADSEGDYEIILSIDVDQDMDFYSVDLEAGDIVGATVSQGAHHLTLRDALGNELVGSGQEMSIYPDLSPLPTGGNATLSWVVDTPGKYTIAVDSGVGLYELKVGTFRPVLESQPRSTRQILFLDFDGADLDPLSTFGMGNSDVTLSPLSAFLERWGLSESDENAVIDAITSSVMENFQDIGLRGKNGNRATDGIDGHYEIQIVTSRDSRDALGFPLDPFEQSNVSRVVIGGSVQELGIEAIGIAESIDVGNFDTGETAVVLLDLLSAPSTDPNSLNQYALGPGKSIIDLIGVAVGNVIAHEAGHFFANWHTNQFNSVAALMDQGGNPDNTFGVGPDRIFGTSDDVDVDFGSDVFVKNEGFTGAQDALNAIAFGLSTGIVDTGMVVVDSSPQAGQQVTVPPTDFVLQFIDPYRTDVPISPAAFSVNGVPASRVEQTSENEITFIFDASPVTQQGLQTMTLAGGAVVRASDGDPVESFTATFGYDQLLMEVVGTQPNEQFIELPLTRFSVSVNEPYDPDSVGIDDLQLSQGEVVGFELVGEQVIAYELSGISEEGTLTIHMPDGALTDVFGNLGTGVTDSYQVDIGTIPFRGPLEPKLPLGSLIYDPSMSGQITSGDVDRFRIVVDPGQTIAVVLQTDNSLRGSLAIRTDDAELESSSADSAGDTVLLHTGPFSGRMVRRESEPTAFTIGVSGLDDTAGSYTLQVLLNAAVKTDTSNDSLATARNIEPAILRLGAREAERGAVMGSLVGTEIISEDFETGSLGGAWTTASSTAQGRVRVTSDFGSADGEFALWMDVNADRVSNLNEAVWTVDLTGHDRAILSFSHANFSDEPAPFNGSFQGRANADGVAISEDGNTWYPVFDAPDSPPGEWQRFHVDLGDEAVKAGITLDGPLQIKFQQFDNFPLVTDGRGWDQITITEGDRSDWYRLRLDEDDSLMLAATAQTVGDVGVELYDAEGTLLAEGLHIPRPVQNGSFETGTLDGWSSQVTGDTDVPWQVSGADAGGDFGIDRTSPQDGSFVAWNGFDGAGPMQFVLSQDVFIPADAPRAELSWQDRVQWVFFTEGAAAKTYEVHLRDAATDQLLQTLHSFSTGPQTQNRTGDTGWQTHTVDLLAYAGSTVRIVFVEAIPESFTGPGQVEIDAVNIDLGFTRPANVDDVIQNFRAPEAGEYFARISGTPFVEYSLLLTRNTEFDIEDNNSTTAAQPILTPEAGGRRWVLGHVDGTESSGSDFYQVIVQSNQQLSVSTFTPAKGSGEFVNTLDPMIRVYDATGSLVASDDNSGRDQRNAALRYRVPRSAGGVYFIEVTPSDLTAAATSGEYVLEIQGADVPDVPLAAVAAAADALAAVPVGQGKADTDPAVTSDGSQGMASNAEIFPGRAAIDLIMTEHDSNIWDFERQPGLDTLAAYADGDDWLSDAASSEI